MTEREIDLVALEGGEPVRRDFLPFNAPSLGDDEIAEVADTIRSGWIGTGPKTQRFEKMFQDYIGCHHAVAVNSCTAGLHLSLILSNVGPGDEVITTPLTFAATANVIVHQGARPVFVDIDRATLNIDPSLIEAKITERTKAIIPVHFGGLACDMDDILALAAQYGLAIIEDAAHALGGKYRGVMVGSLDTLACFSFYPNKNLTTGEGGMVTTNDASMAEKLTIYRLHGLSKDAWQRFQVKKLLLSEVLYPGYKYNMTDLQASLGIHQLMKQERFYQIRKRYAQMYDDALNDLPEVTLQPRPKEEENRHALHLYLLILNLERLSADRDRIVSALRAENIGAAIHYKALHLHPFYRKAYGYGEGMLPNAEHISERVLSLPLTPSMSEEDVEDVIKGVRKVLRYYRV